MSTTTEPTSVDGWEELGTVDGYRLVGVEGLAWFALGPRNNVIAHPPAQLDKWEALDWFRAHRREPAPTEGLA